MKNRRIEFNALLARIIEYSCSSVGVECGKSSKNIFHWILNRETYIFLLLWLFEELFRVLKKLCYVTGVHYRRDWGKTLNRMTKLTLNSSPKFQYLCSRKQVFFYEFFPLIVEVKINIGLSETWEKRIFPLQIDIKLDSIERASFRYLQNEFSFLIYCLEFCVFFICKSKFLKWSLNWQKHATVLVYFVSSCPAWQSDMWQSKSVQSWTMNKDEAEVSEVEGNSEIEKVMVSYEELLQ